jgi:hypothetical protein
MNFIIFFVLLFDGSLAVNYQVTGIYTTIENKSKVKAYSFFFVFVLFFVWMVYFFLLLSAKCTTQYDTKLLNLVHRTYSD